MYGYVYEKHVQMGTLGEFRLGYTICDFRKAKALGYLLQIIYGSDASFRYEEAEHGTIWTFGTAGSTVSIHGVICRVTRFCLPPAFVPLPSHTHFEPGLLID